MLHNHEKLSNEFYQHEDVLGIARSLIGKQIFTQIDGYLTGGIIAETEAYNGISDRASHAYGGRKTNRTEVMYREGGIAYVYFSYGMHYLFNVVTGKKDNPQAVLIRGIIPTIGIETILKRRNQVKINSATVNGPAKLCQALGISLKQNTISLRSDTLWIEEARKIGPGEIFITTRVGIDYAGDDASLPYRFILMDKDYRTAKK